MRAFMRSGFLTSHMHWAMPAAVGAAFCWLPAVAAAQTAAGPSLPVLVGSGGAGSSFSVPIQTLLFFTALSFLPALLLMMTGFTRIVIVLSLLRQALGTQSAPPNQVIIGLSLFLTLFVMGPTLDRVYQDAYVPYTSNQMEFEDALKKAELPVREFMARQTRQSDFALFSRLAKLEPGTSIEDAPFRVVVPAFVISELKTAFQIGFMIFIPFLIIDMVVSSILMSLGMMMLSPVLVALPFKIMLFVLADGWNLLVGSLAASFAISSAVISPLSSLSSAFLIIFATSSLRVIDLAVRSASQPPSLTHSH